MGVADWIIGCVVELSLQFLPQILASLTDFMWFQRSKPLIIWLIFVVVPPAILSHHLNINWDVIQGTHEWQRLSLNSIGFRIKASWILYYVTPGNSKIQVSELNQQQQDQSGITKRMLRKPRYQVAHKVLICKGRRPLIKYRKLSRPIWEQLKWEGSFIHSREFG